MAALRAAADRGYEFYDRTSATLKGVMPKGLYARALLIIIAPMVVLQSVVAFMFIKRHYPARQESSRAHGSLERVHMLALEGMMKVQRNRGMYPRGRKA